MKQGLRKEFLVKRKEMDPMLRKLADIAIYESVIQFALDPALPLLTYRSTNFEVDTFNIIDKAISMGINVFVPKVDKSLHSMDFFMIDSDIKYDVATRSISLVPLVAFKRNGDRLGMGGGYYDRFLVKANTIKIGLAYSFQETNVEIAEEHDIPLHYCITEKEIIECT